GRRARVRTSECGAAESALRIRLRRNAGSDGAPPARLRAERLREHCRRLLRHDPGAHPRDPGGGRQAAPTKRSAKQLTGFMSVRPLRLSGLEPLVIGEGSLFVNIGERTNVTGSKAFARLVLSGDFAGAVEVARQQVQNGAQIIDVNMDEAML